MLPWAACFEWQKWRQSENRIIMDLIRYNPTHTHARTRMHAHTHTHLTTILLTWFPTYPQNHIPTHPVPNITPYIYVPFHSLWRHCRSLHTCWWARQTCYPLGTSHCPWKPLHTNSKEEDMIRYLAATSGGLSEEVWHDLKLQPIQNEAPPQQIISWFPMLDFPWRATGFRIAPSHWPFSVHLFEMTAQMSACAALLAGQQELAKRHDVIVYQYKIHKWHTQIR